MVKVILTSPLLTENIHVPSHEDKERGYHTLPCFSHTALLLPYHRFFNDSTYYNYMRSRIIYREPYPLIFHVLTSYRKLYLMPDNHQVICFDTLVGGRRNYYTIFFHIFQPLDSIKNYFNFVFSFIM